mgnify:CR=1 FL=1
MTRDRKVDIDSLELAKAGCANGISLQLEKVIKSLNNDLENVILFGHNAALTNFVNKFGDIFIENVPTSGLVWIKFDCLEWKLLKKGKTQKVILPRDLKYE